MILLNLRSYKIMVRKKEKETPLLPLMTLKSGSRRWKGGSSLCCFREQTSQVHPVAVPLSLITVSPVCLRRSRLSKDTAVFVRMWALWKTYTQTLPLLFSFSSAQPEVHHMVSIIVGKEKDHLGPPGQFFFVLRKIPCFHTYIYIYIAVQEGSLKFLSISQHA